MIYLLYGDEYYLIKEKIDNIIKESAIDNIISIDFSSSNIRNILNEVNYIDLFNTRKLIVINNFSLKKINSDDEKELIRYFENKNDNVLIFNSIDQTIDNRKNIIKKFIEYGNLYEAHKLDRKSLQEYLKELFKKEKYKISDENIKKIINNCNFNNMSANNNFIFNEVNKLMLYKMEEKEITSEDINNIVSKNTEMELFNLVNAVTSRNTDMVFKELKIIKELDISPYIIVANISKQFRLMLQIKLLSEKMALDSIARKLAMNPYAIEINAGNSKNYSLYEILNVIDKLFYVDEKLKSETVDKFKLLEKLLLEIC